MLQILSCLSKKFLLCCLLVFNCLNAIQSWQSNNFYTADEPTVIIVYVWIHTSRNQIRNQSLSITPQKTKVIERWIISILRLKIRNLQLMVQWVINSRKSRSVYWWNIMTNIPMKELFLNFITKIGHTYRYIYKSKQET